MTCTTTHISSLPQSYCNPVKFASAIYRATPEQSTMSTPILEDLNRFIDFINSGDTDIGKEIVSESAIFHIPFGSGPLKGLDGYLQILGMMRGAFPDIQWTLQETVCEGDTVVARFETKGTHNGFFMGVPPTGKPICMSAVNTYRFQGGRLSRRGGCRIFLGL
ncbi:hypothetical protein P3342_006253 [Pyrenophora teres f. teres]|nr:hypothetical protein P3342_006253 [Pyrenophora teres f. teres]